MARELTVLRKVTIVREKHVHLKFFLSLDDHARGLKVKIRKLNKLQKKDQIQSSAVNEISSVKCSKKKQEAK